MSKSRDRRVLVCAFCKRRKIKCDRNMPCGACAARKQQCIYQESESATPRDRQSMSELWKSDSEDAYQKFQAFNPYSGAARFNINDQYDSFLQIGSSTSRSYGPLSWVSLVLTDAAMVPMLRKKINEALDMNFANVGTEKLFAKKFKHEPLINEHLRFSELAKSLGLTVAASTGDQHHNIVRKAINLLPTRDVIWSLIDCFFANVYPFFPIIDQQSFESWVVDVMGPSRAELPVETLAIEKQMEIAKLGILLLVLRFGYLSVFATFGPSTSDSPQTAYIRDHPIPIDMFDVAKECLQYFEFLRMANFTTIQLGLLLKLYYMYAPENGPTPEDSNYQSFSSLLVKSAMSIGLHRDPDHFKYADYSKQEAQLRRKVWYAVLYTEYVCGINSGLPLAVSPSDFDTKLPVYESTGENCRDVAHEKMVPDMFKNVWYQYQMFFPMSLLISNVRSGASEKAICSSLTEWETTIFPKFPSPLTYSGVLEINDSYKVIGYFETRSLYATVLFRLFVHFHSRDNDLAYFYLKKVTALVLKDMSKICATIESSMEPWFGTSSEMCFVPPFESYVHRGVIISLSILFQTRFALFGCETREDHEQLLVSDEAYRLRYKSLQDVYELTDKVFAVFLQCFEKLSSRFYYSWRLCVAQREIQKQRKGVDFYTRYYSPHKELHLGTEMLHDFKIVLSEIVQETDGVSVVPQESLYTEWDDLMDSFNKTSEFWSSIVPQAMSPDELDIFF